MIKKNDKLFQNYTDSDLKYFDLLENDRKYNFYSSSPNNTVRFSKTIHYTKSDNKQFLKLMNFHYNSSEENSTDYSMDKELEFYNKKENLLDSSFYNESDIKKFNKLKKLSFHVDSYSPKYLENNKDDLKIKKTNYTTKDLKLFSLFFGPNKNKKNLKSLIDKNSIKILDFEKLQKNNKIKNKKIKEKIKVVYFD